MSRSSILRSHVPVGALPLTLLLWLGCASTPTREFVDDGGGAAAAGTAGAAGGSYVGGSAGSSGEAGSRGAGASAGAAGSTAGAAGSTAGAAGSAGNAGSAGMSGGAGAGGSTAVEITARSPAMGADAVDSEAPWEITLNQEIDVASLMVNTSAGPCVGGLRISGNEFQTCLPISVSKKKGASGPTYLVTPLSPYPSRAPLKLRLVGPLDLPGGGSASANHTDSAATNVRYYHTIVIDGINDFGGNELFATSSSGYSAYIAWDKVALFLGMKGPDIASSSIARFWLAYLGTGSSGTTQGVSYNTQAPSLPFSASHHVRWKMDNSFTDLVAYQSSWPTMGQSLANGVKQTGDFVELRIPFASLGDPAKISLAMALIHEASLQEGSYGALPSMSFVDGYDPDYAKFYEFTRVTSAAPASKAPSP